LSTVSPGLKSMPLSVMSAPSWVACFKFQPFGGLTMRNERPPTRLSISNAPLSLTDDAPKTDAVAGMSSVSVGVAMRRSVVMVSGFSPPSKTIRPVAVAPRLPVTTRSVMSSPVTMTLAVTNSRWAGAGA